ncbi:MAG: D-alanine--D-alanine ligase [Bacteroidetes bacterium]|nr:D-alanine--D-alanine ligase [Bacteroidota bacterium]
MYNIAIVAGGNSGEYDISMKSGKQVELHMDLKKFRPFLIEIRGTKWNYKLESKSFFIDKNDFSLAIGKRKIRFDAVFNAIHGTPGEDGRLQGYFDMLGIPYTSCGLMTSALSFNKSFCKDVVAGYGTDVARSVHLYKGDSAAGAEVIKHLTLPVFVKPNCGGSSVGMSKVNFKKDLKTALDIAFKEDDEIIVEEFIKGRELTCGVIRSKGKIIAFPVTEIISKKEFFDYEAKYQPGMAEEVVPADVPAKVAEKCREISVNLFRKLNCKGIVRFDYIFTGRKFYFLEVNTVPGITSASIVPKMAKAYGWTYSDLITNLLNEII